MLSLPLEDYVIILLVSIVTLGTVVAVKNNGIRAKKAKNETFEQYQEMMATALKDAKDRIKSLQGAVNRYRGMYGEGEPEEEVEDHANDVIIEQLAAKFNIPKDLLNSPDVRAGLNRILKDKTVKSLLPFVSGALGKANQSDPLQATIAAAIQNGNYA
jgi:hypothetical protein